jgi:sigma-B regulation protein RsbU (phosphoserine phosphatase)
LSEDRRTLALFANQAAIALENAKLHKLALEKERLEREMELAAEIQQQILPKVLPQIPGYEVAGWNRPARQVGGDYYNLSEPQDGRFSLVVGDVTGKGMPAALMVSTFHSALRLLGDRMAVGEKLVRRLNAHIYESSNLNKFITMFLAELEPQSGTLRYLNAGHNPGVVIRCAGGVEELPSGGLPLGLMAGATYESNSLILAEGDLLCLYSDGITECESAAEEEYGLERLTELLKAQSRQPLAEIIETIDRTMLEFAHGCPQGDDQTVLLLRRSLPNRRGPSPQSSGSKAASPHTLL